MPAGRPLKYDNVEDMQKVIDEYFKSCEGEVLKDEDGNVVFNKYGQPVIVGHKPLTITGLALALGFNSRQSLLNYKDKEEFLDTIMRAKSKVEEYVESRLFDKEGSNGAKFSLTNNFVLWKEKTEVVSDNTNTNLNIEADDSIREKLAEKLMQMKGDK